MFVDSMQITMVEFMLDFIFMMKQIRIFQIIRDLPIHGMKNNPLLKLTNYLYTFTVYSVL